MSNGFSICPFTPADIQAVFELELAYARAFPGAPVIPAEAYLSPGFHQGQDVFCAYQGDCLAAYAPVYVHLILDGPADQPYVAWAEVKARPDLADPWPVKDALLEQLIERARAVTRASARESNLPERPVRIMFDYHNNEIAAIEYIQSHGFDYVQSAFEMTRDLSEPVGRMPLPEGFSLRRWKMESEPEQRAYAAARNECFPNAPIQLETWQYFMRSAEWENGTTIACFEGQDLLGNVNVYWNEDEMREAGIRFGYTEDIFVRPEWRGKGIARAMISEGMRFLQEKGMAEARLTVAARNETALGLYLEMGYRVTQESRHYAIAQFEPRN